MLKPEDILHEVQALAYSLLIAESIDPGIIIIHAPEYEDNGSGINPEW